LVIALSPMLNGHLIAAALARWLAL
jgi:hypothetical protein